LKISVFWDVMPRHWASSPWRQCHVTKPESSA